MFFYRPRSRSPIHLRPNPLTWRWNLLVSRATFSLSHRFFDGRLVPDTAATSTPAPHDWESIASGQLDIKEVQIPSAVLECLRRQTKRSPIPLSSQPSQALVLYRAPRPPSPKPLEQACDRQEGKPTSLVAHEDDVMEVE